MPANLPPPYLEAEQRYREASRSEEKIAALEEMITLLPKHKGTEKIHADLKSRLAKLRKQGDKKGGPARRSSELVIEREGAGQILLLGGPNTGKSALVAALTNAPVEVTDYPFATHKPVPGAMRYEDVRIQIVDMPSISADYVDPNLLTLARKADASVLCVDLSSPDCLDQPDWVLSTLEAGRVFLERGTVSNAPKGGAKKILPTLVAATKVDHPDASTVLELVKEVLANRFPIALVSVHQPDSLAAFARACFDLFGIVRVYSKMPGKEPDRRAPFLLSQGSTLIDFAAKVHHDFRDRLAFARVWGANKYDGQRVARDYVLLDLDVVEMHMK